MLNININKDDFNVNDYLIVFDSFGVRPNKIVLYDNYDPKKFKKILRNFKNSEVDDNYLTEIIPGEESSSVNDRVFSKINENIYISYVQVNRGTENHIIGEVNIYYKCKIDAELVQTIIKSLDECVLDIQSKNEFEKLNTLVINSGQLEVDPIKSIELKKFDDHYNTDTLRSISKIIKKLKKKEKGMTILWGDRGTGKTSAAKYISQEIDRMSIFIPNNMVDTTINNPDFKSFLKRHPKLMLIIDDCEIFFNEAYTKSNIFTSNMIQLVDGFLSDEIEVQILLIFNVDREDNIDHSLLDCNHLLDVIEFEYLDEETSNDLLKLNGHKSKLKGKNRMIDVIKNESSKPSIIGLN